MKKLIPFLLVLSGCAKFQDGTSVYSDGLWVIPLITGAGAVYFMWRAFQSSKSGSWYWGKDKNGVAKKIETDENVPIYKTGQFIFAAILFLATIGIIIAINASK